MQTRRTITEASSYLALLSSTEPQNVNEACKDECWVKAMNEELEQFERIVLGNYFLDLMTRIP